LPHTSVKTYTLRRFGFLLVGKNPEPSFLGSFPNPLKIRKAKERYHMESENKNKVERKREIIMRLAVTEAERDFIFEKMRLMNTNNFGAYARKMLIDGYAINTDYSDLKSVAAEMQKIGVNINQIAKRVNSTTRIYEQDIEEMKRGLSDIWRLLKSSLSRAV
jgi:hypothetical protein